MRQVRHIQSIGDALTTPLDIISNVFYNCNLDANEADIEAIRVVLALDRAGYEIVDKDYHGALD